MTIRMSLDRILGQPAAVETLTAGLRSERLHHAWIFSGPKGVGKFTTAMELAGILLDPGARETLEAAPGGETARLIEAGAHPDLHVIRKELALYSEHARLRDRKLLNIPIDLLRERMIGGDIEGKFHDAPAYRTPVLGHRKVFIIDEAELIDRVGQNALLKTLEEPPARTYIVLVTSRPQRLLPTVRSRCQHVRFAPLDDEALGAWLDRSGLELGPGERAWTERFCEGAPGLAQLAAEYGFHEWQTRLDPMLAQLDRGRFPAEMGQAMADLVEAFAVAWVKRHDNASKDAANKDGARFVLALLAAHARCGLDGAIEDDAARPGWLAVIDLISSAEQELYANVNLKLVLENLVVQWAQGGGTHSEALQGPTRAWGPFRPHARLVRRRRTRCACHPYVLPSPPIGSTSRRVQMKSATRPLATMSRLSTWPRVRSPSGVCSRAASGWRANSVTIRMTP